jgi:thiamine biosynthesis lipoprotein
MGTDAHLVVVGGSPAALEAARRRILLLERRWSRFRQDSEISRLNAAAGRAVIVSGETAELVAAAVEAWRWTGGLFDPTVLPFLVAAGYDRSFEQLPPDRRGGPADAPERRAPGCGRVVVNPGTGLVILPPGVALDIGGIAKGLAADWVTEQLLTEASGACVNVGGDVRVGGDPPSPEGWVVSVEHPTDGRRELVRLALADGAVCTSSRARRRWNLDGREHHHLIDPSRGVPVRSPVVAATVVAGRARQAEVLCKAVMVGGWDRALPLLQGEGASAIAVREDGRVEHLHELQRFAA